MTKTKFCIILVGILSATLVFAQQSNFKEQVLSAEPSAVEIHPNVFFVDSDKGERIYAAGLAGAHFLLEHLEGTLERQSVGLNTHEQLSLEEFREEAKAFIREANTSEVHSNDINLTATDSGSLCARPYELVAEANHVGQWSVSTNSQASFQQNAVGPQIPGEVTLRTYGSLEYQVDGAWYFYEDSDTKTFDVQGWQNWVEADPIQLTYGPTSECMMVEALSTISSSGCINDGFFWVSESTTRFCDN